MMIPMALALCCAIHAQESDTNANHGAPKFLNMVHQELKPGRLGAYDELESSIARVYNRENIPVYWVELDSMTGPPEVLSLNFYASTEEMDKAMVALNAGVAAHPELVQMQDRLLQENTSSG